MNYIKGSLKETSMAYSVIWGFIKISIRYITFTKQVKDLLLYALLWLTSLMAGLYLCIVNLIIKSMLMK